MTDAYTELAQVLDGAIETKARRVFAPHLDEFATVLETGPPVVLELQESHIKVPEDQLYWDRGCRPQTLAAGDVVMVIAVSDEFHVVGVSTHGEAARNGAPAVSGSREGNLALAALLKALSDIGLVDDQTTA